MLAFFEYSQIFILFSNDWFLLTLFEISAYCYLTCFTSIIYRVNNFIGCYETDQKIVKISGKFYKI